MVCLQFKTIDEVTRALYVSHSTVERIVHLYKTTGDVTSIQQRHGPCRVLGEIEVLELFLNNPGIYLKEVLFNVCGKWVECSTLTRQKMKRVAIQQSNALRAQYMAEIEAFDPSMVIKQMLSVYLDMELEVSHPSLTIYSHNLLAYGQRISAISIISTRGIEDVYLAEGSVNGDTFVQFIQRSLLNIRE